MERTELIMGMPITVSIPDRGRAHAPDEIFEKVFTFFRDIDARFSPYKQTSEVSRIARGEVAESEYSPQMREVCRICDETARETSGAFSAWYSGKFDPSGVVKGWAVHEASLLLEELGHADHCIDAGGDIEVRGLNGEGGAWEIGIRNPFDPTTLVKVLRLSNRGVATSGTYIRGNHIFDPKTGHPIEDGFASLTVVAQNVCEADRLSTPAFVMGEAGLGLLATLPGVDAYVVGRDGSALFTPGLARYLP